MLVAAAELMEIWKRCTVSVVVSWSPGHGPTTSQPKRTVGLFGNGFQLGTACRPAPYVLQSVPILPIHVLTCHHVIYSMMYLPVC